MSNIRTLERHFSSSWSKVYRRHRSATMAASCITPLLAGPARFPSVASRSLHRHVTEGMTAWPSHLRLPVQRSPASPLSRAPASRFTTAAAGDDGLTVQKTEEEWRAILTPEQFRILRLKGTEYDNGFYSHLALMAPHIVVSRCDKLVK